MKPLTGDTLTTGQVGKILGMSAVSIQTLFDSGKVPGVYRTPTKSERRITRQDLERYLRENNLPLGALQPGLPVMLAVGVGKEFTDQMLDRTRGRYLFVSSPIVLEAGILIERRRPLTVILDASVGRNEALWLAGEIRRDVGHYGCVVTVILAAEDEQDPHCFTRAGFDCSIQKPIRHQQAIDKILDLTAKREKFLREYKGHKQVPDRHDLLKQEKQNGDQQVTD